MNKQKDCTFLCLVADKYPHGGAFMTPSRHATVAFRGCFGSRFAQDVFLPNMLGEVLDNRKNKQQYEKSENPRVAHEVRALLLHRIIELFV